MDSWKRPQKGGLEPGRGNSSIRLPGQDLEGVSLAELLASGALSPAGKGTAGEGPEQDPLPQGGRGRDPGVNHAKKTPDGLPDKLTALPAPQPLPLPSPLAQPAPLAHCELQTH